MLLQPKMSRIRAMIFDVDGTLYSNKRVKTYILKYLVTKVLYNPSIINEIRTVQAFRKYRENLINCKSRQLRLEQYKIVADRLNIDINEVQDIVHKWMFEMPLKYLPKCKYKGIDNLWRKLRERQVLIGVFSDYPAESKLDVLDLSCDVAICSTDYEVDALKPDPKGLFKIADTLGIKIQECLFIGDREDKDGECARNAGMPYLILEKNFFKSNTENHISSYSELERMI